MTTEMKIKYTEYPECMFSIIAACLPANEGREVRLLAGEVFFRSEDNQGRTYRNGLLHSFDDQPAMIDDFGTQLWYRDGVVHRDGDLPAYVGDQDFDETQRWYKNGVLHREGGPVAIEDSGLQGIYQEWWFEGRRHRVGGPAFISNRGSDWWENGIFIRQELR